MKKYEKPELDITYFEVEDIVTSSGCGRGGNGAVNVDDEYCFTENN